MDYDLERVGTIVSDIERYLADLNSIEIKKIDDLRDKRNFYSLSMLMFSILNRVIDLGEEVIVSENLGTPATYKDIFILLSKNGVIKKDVEKELSSLVFYRNLLAHEYYRLTEKEVFSVYKKIGAAREFAETVKKRLRLK